MKKLLILFAVCTWEYAAVQAQSVTTTYVTTTVAPDTEPNNFFKKAAMADIMEIEAGELAISKAVNAEVRSFGEMMVRDHTNSAKELRAIASRRNITIPDHSKLHGSQGASTITTMGTTGSTKYYSDIQVTQGNADSWFAYNPNNTTRSISGTETYWTPGFRGKVGISTRNTGSSSNRTMSSSGSSRTTIVTERDVDMDDDVVIVDDDGVIIDTDLDNTTVTTTTVWYATEPSQLELDEHYRKLNRLREKTGKNFDEEYLQMMSSDHNDVIDLYEDASNSSDTEIRDFANRMLPTIRQHQTSAKALLDKLDSVL